MNNQLITELPGLVAYYPHTEGTGTTLNDYKGSNNGTIINAIWKKNTKGNYGLEYSGSTYRTPLGSSITLSGSFTINIWVNVDSFDSHAYAMLFGNSVNNVTFVGLRDATGDNLVIFVPSTELRMALSTNIVGDGLWHMLTYTRDNSGLIHGYVDGVQLTQTRTNTTSFTLNQLGRYYTDASYDYNGHMTDIFIADEEYTPELINQIYKKTYRA